MAIGALVLPAKLGDLLGIGAPGGDRHGQLIGLAGIAQVGEAGEDVQASG